MTDFFRVRVLGPRFSANGTYDSIIMCADIEQTREVCHMLRAMGKADCWAERYGSDSNGRLNWMWLSSEELKTGRLREKSEHEL